MEFFSVLSLHCATAVGIKIRKMLSGISSPESCPPLQDTASVGDRDRDGDSYGDLDAVRLSYMHSENDQVRCDDILTRDVIRNGSRRKFGRGRGDRGSMPESANLFLKADNGGGQIMCV